MTAPVSLEDLKLHARIDSNAEDSAVTGYLSAATESVRQYLNLVDPLDDTAPAPVKSAILLMAAGLYANRLTIGRLWPPCGHRCSRWWAVNL